MSGNLKAPFSTSPAWLLAAPCQRRQKLMARPRGKAPRCPSAGAASRGMPAPETRRIAGADRLVRRSPTFVCDLACSMVRQVCASPRERPAWATSHTSALTCPDAPLIVSFVRFADERIGCSHSSGHARYGKVWHLQIAPVQRRRSSCTCLANLSTRRLLSASKAPQDPPL